MKINDNFILRDIAGDHILVPVGDTALKLSGMIAINDIGCLIYNALKENKTVEEIVKDICNEYEIDEDSAKEDVVEFLTTLKDHDILITDEKL
ncbi:MAG: PqqD family protein [Erysipelotrichaceae bacterium]|nr:PqqD family protein [Erysipelotrichaceae bacterium]